MHSDNTATDYLDASYIVNGESVMLSDDNNNFHVFGNEATGDIDGDGSSDIVFLFTQDTGGGSGVFFYVAAALKKGEKYQGTNAVFLGDRIAPQTTEIHSGDIIVNYAIRKPADPMTTDPNVGVSMYLLISGSTLREVRK